MSLSAVIILATGFRSDGGPPVALMPLGGLPAVAHALRALASVRRLQRPQQDIFIVVNQSDMPLFLGATGLLQQLPGERNVGPLTFTDIFALQYLRLRCHSVFDSPSIGRTHPITHLCTHPAAQPHIHPRFICLPTHLRLYALTTPICSSMHSST